MEKKTNGKNELAKDYIDINTYRELIDRRMETAPDVPAFRSKNHRTGEELCVYPEEFSRQVDGLSAWLSGKGYRRTHIAILGENSYQWVLTMFAVICSDNVLVTLDKGLEFITLHSLVGRSDSRVLFYSEEYEEKAVKLKEEYDLDLYLLSDVPGYASEGLSAGNPGRISTDPDAMAILMYTSGTTGPAKGVMLSQRNAMNNLSRVVTAVDVSGDSIFLLPLNHIYGLVPALLVTFVNGYTITINLNLRYMMEDIREARPDVLILVPLFLENIYNSIWKSIRAKNMESAVRGLIEKNRAEGVTNAVKREMFKDILAPFGGKVTRIISGGAPLNMRLYEGFRDFGIEVLNGYGITETSPVLAVNNMELNKPESVGKIVPGEEVKIDSPDNYGDGEICVRSSSVMLGYYKDEERTREALRDGWFYTGDKGFLDEDNYVYINGRIKNLIILSNGENVSPEELEGMIADNSAVREVLVYEKDGLITAEILKDEDFLIDSGIGDGEAYIRKYISDLNKDLAVYKRIGAVLFRDTPFERTSSKKIKRIYRD